MLSSQVRVRLQSRVIRDESPIIPSLRVIRIIGKSDDEESLPARTAGSKNEIVTARLIRERAENAKR
jgi:hypothetical protein